METRSSLKFLDISNFQGYLKEISSGTKLKSWCQIQIQFSDEKNLKCLFLEISWELSTSELAA